MRRQDREVTEPERIRQIISACTCCRLGFCDQGQAYIVPLSFGFTERDGKYTFYFHSAKEGRKIDLIRRTGYAAFEMDTNYQLRTAAAACAHSASYQSIMGGGPVAFVEDPAEKEAALQAIMLHTAGKDGWTFSAQMLDSVCVFRLTAETLSCKERR